MKKMLFSAVLFLAGAVGFFGVLTAAAAGSGGGYSNCFRYINTAPEYLAAGVSLGVMVFGLAWCVKQLGDGKDSQ